MTQDDPLATLRLYGLEELLTEEDDPCLWAAAVAKHLPRPDDPNARSFHGVPQLDFGVGVISQTGGRAAGEIEHWTLERTDDKRYKARRGIVDYPDYFLEISRPSSGADSARVHSGFQVFPRSGRGITTEWRHEPDGSWVETDNIVSAWVS